MAAFAVAGIDVRPTWKATNIATNRSRTMARMRSMISSAQVDGVGSDAAVGVNVSAFEEGGVEGALRRGRRLDVWC